MADRHTGSSVPLPQDNGGPTYGGAGAADLHDEARAERLAPAREQVRTEHVAPAGPVSDGVRTEHLAPGGVPSGQAVRVEGTGVRVAGARGDLPRAEARRRFGGLDVPAAIAGTLAALGLLVALTALLAGAGTIGYQQGLRDADTLSLAGLVSGAVVLFLSLLFGGWVAGRMARYDGMRNGLLTAVLLVLLTAGLAAVGNALGNDNNVSAAAHLPTWVTGGATTTRAVVTGLVALLLALLAGALGGRLGARWHRRVDDVLIGTRDGGVPVYPTETDVQQVRR